MEAVPVAGDACHWPILGGFQAVGCVAGMWVGRKDGGLTSVWLEAGRVVYPFVYQGCKYLKLKEYLLITNQLEQTHPDSLPLTYVFSLSITCGLWYNCS